MKRERKLFSLLMGLFFGIGIFSSNFILNKKANKTEASNELINGTYLYIEDQSRKGWTNDGVDPVAHLYNVTFAEGSGYSQISDVKNNAFGSSLTTGRDYIDVKMSWIDGGSNRPYQVTIPWYISGFTVCFYAKEKGNSRYLYQEGNGDAFSFGCSSGTSLKIYSGSWDGYNAWWDGSKFRSKISLSANSDFQYTEEKYSVITSANNNGTIEDCSGTYFKGQKLSLNATPDNGYSFDCWDFNNSSVSTNSSFVTDPIMSDGSFIANFYKPYTAGRYLVDSDNNLDEVIFFSDAESGKPSNIFSLEKGYSFKLAWVSIKGVIDNYSSYDDIDANNSDAISCLTTNSNRDIVINFTAKYVISYDYNNGGKLEIDLSKESYDANQLAATVYSFTKYFNDSELNGNGLGYCTNSDRYPAMRAIFEGLPFEEKVAFKAMAGTNDGVKRYIAWAIANNDTNNVIYEGWMTPELLNKVNYGNYYNSLIDLDDDDSAVLVAVVTAIASSALLGIYILKRKKHF